MNSDPSIETCRLQQPKILVFVLRRPDLVLSPYDLIVLFLELLKLFV